ncbi:MAG: hypothetical protein FWC73_12005 [Defluviitaleaceae bacterium]|nr:hypothetical protein [Defluviitaleaceae bacterium]
MAKNLEFSCPFCFEVCQGVDIHFRCDNIHCYGDIDDQILAEYERVHEKKMRPWMAPNAMGKLSKVPELAICPACNTQAREILCPHCHNKINRSTLEGRDILISIIGTRDAGKSNYIGVIIKELIERIGPDGFNATIRPLNDDIGDRYNATYGSYLYNNPPQRLPQTDSSIDEINEGAYRPYIYRMRFTRKVLFKEIHEDFNLVLFDVAGDDVSNLYAMKSVVRYIGKSAGIIFIIDPTRMDDLSHKLPEEIKKQASQAFTSDTAFNVIQRVSDLVMENLPRGTTKIDIPIAATFSKIDALRWEEGTYSEKPVVVGRPRFFNPSTHVGLGAFDLNDQYQVHEEIQGMLGAWGARPFVTLLGDNYSNYSFFAVSALGFDYSLNSDGSMSGEPVPHRVEDPILWIFKENAVIKGKNGKLNRKERSLSREYKMRPYSGKIKVLAALILLVVILAPMIFAFAHINNNDINAFLYVDMVEVSPRTALRGPTAISATFDINDRGFGWGRQRIDFRLIPLGGDIAAVEGSTVSFFFAWPRGSHTITLFTHDFVPLSDYVLSVYINGTPYHPITLHGE